MTSYHWIITLQCEGIDGPRTGTFSGTLTAPGATRRQVYDKLADDAKRKIGSDDVVVLFFSLEPDEL
jgi:hypothetical protein